MSLPRIPSVSYGTFHVPDYEECKCLWDQYAMPDHIRSHSLAVCKVSELLGEAAGFKGQEVDMPILKASALLHDIAKAYCIKHGGAHSQLGASIAREHTGNPVIAQAVMHHVFWPKEINIYKYFLPLVIIYADKRIKHDRVVPVEERFADLFDRYGFNPKREKKIQKSKEQIDIIEKELENLIGVELHAHSFDCRRLV